MTKLLGRKMQGFTLIELLIVIAILGILAVAVLSAINPVEQIRKANDARRRSNSAELLNGLERYYTTYGEYPAAFSFDAAGPGELVTSAYISALGSELKTEFQTRISNADNYVYAWTEAGTELAHVCFEIESEEQINKYATETTYSTAGGIVICLPE